MICSRPGVLLAPSLRVTDVVHVGPEILSALFHSSSVDAQEVGQVHRHLRKPIDLHFQRLPKTSKDLKADLKGTLEALEAKVLMNFIEAPERPDAPHL